MIGERCNGRGLAALLLPALLLASCGGDGTRDSSFDDPAPGLRTAAAEDSRQVLPFLEEITPALPPELQRDTAVRDLGLVDPEQSVRVDVASADFGRLTVEQLGSALLDEGPAVRQAAIDSLIGESHEVLTERLPLLKYALSDPDEGVRESVVAALAGWQDPRAIALLLEARGDQSPIVREEAREALAKDRVEVVDDDEGSLHYGD